MTRYTCAGGEGLGSLWVRRRRSRRRNIEFGRVHRGQARECESDGPGKYRCGGGGTPHGGLRP
eukprot:scaffold14511_cov180-Isochrysis_galbana.AAC.1